jgi:uncharacterized membrane protein YczE
MQKILEVPMQKILEVSPQRWLKLYGGLICYGVGISFMKQSQLGLSPWEVLHDGISKLISVQIGTVSIFIGILILLLWIPMREKPGIGTISNILIVGTITNLTLPLIPLTSQILIQIAWLIIGLLMVGLATALYLGSRMGAGPRDGLMMAFHRRTGRSIRLVRTIIEVSVLVIGFLLGGTIGIGTLASAFAIGPIIQFMFYLIGDHEMAASRKKA